MNEFGKIVKAEDPSCQYKLHPIMQFEDALLTVLIFDSILDNYVCMSLIQLICITNNMSDCHPYS